MEIKLEEVKGKLLENLPKGSKITEKILEEALEKASRRVWKRSEDTAPKAIGNLKKSITRELTPTYARVYPQVKYAFYVHEGTRPHWVPPQEIAPGGSLYRWAKKKGIPPFLVARAIARKGTKAQPWLAKVGETEWKRVQKDFIKALDEIVTALTK